MLPDAEVSPGRSTRSLWPREHGAYAQLLAPLATALALQSPAISGVLFALAVCSAFLANEPLLVVLGHRGRRRRETDGSRAARRLAWTLGIAGATGIAALAIAPRAADVMAGVAAIPAAFVIALAWLGSEHSLSGELMAAVALPGASAPVAVAGGLPWHTAVGLWLAWSIGYACTVVAVHRVIARHRQPPTWRDRIAAIVLGAIAVTGVALARCFAAAMLVVPLAATSALIVALAPRATRLRAIGIAMVAASVATAALAILQ